MSTATEPQTVSLEREALESAAPQLYAGSKTAAGILITWANTLDHEAESEGGLQADLHRQRAAAYRDLFNLLAPGIAQAEGRGE